MNEFDKFIDGKISGDAEFQASLENLGDDEKTNAIEAKKIELLKTEAPIFFENSSKHEKAYNDQKTRAEKAEADLKKIKPPVDNKKDESSMSTKDFYALNKANVPEEDVDDVLEYAKFKGISVQDALASSVVKATLAEKSEVRRTAQATNTRQTRSQNTKTDGASIIANVKGGKGEDALPNAGTEDAEALFWARRGRKPQA